MANWMANFRRQCICLVNLINNQLQSEIILKEILKFTMELTFLIKRLIDSLERLCILVMQIMSYVSLNPRLGQCPFVTLPFKFVEKIFHKDEDNIF